MFFFPLSQIAGTKGLVLVHNPWSLTDLSHLEQHFVSFMNESQKYIREFTHVTHSNQLTSGVIYTLLTSTLTLKEKQAV